MIADSQPTLKVCCACGTVLPVDQFRLRKRGGTVRQGRCRECYNGYTRAYRAARRSKRLRQFTAQFRRAKSLTRVSALIAGTAAYAGGLDALCRQWANSLRTAPPAVALRAFGVIARMAEYLDSQQRQQPDVVTLTDAQLDEEIRRLLAGL